jgi:hypothetical protein
MSSGHCQGLVEPILDLCKGIYLWVLSGWGVERKFDCAWARALEEKILGILGRGKRGL